MNEEEVWIAIGKMGLPILSLTSETREILEINISENLSWRPKIVKAKITWEDK